MIGLFLDFSLLVEEEGASFLFLPLKLPNLSLPSLPFLILSILSS